MSIVSDVYEENYRLGYEVGYNIGLMVGSIQDIDEIRMILSTLGMQDEKIEEILSSHSISD